MHRAAVRKVVIYRVLIWTLLICSILILVNLAPILSKPEYFRSDDFVPFWAGGRLNIAGDNPYDPQNIEQLQIAAGGEPSGSYTISIVLNPPWAISLVMPFGYIDYKLSRIVWLISSILLILLSSQLLWKIFSGNDKQRWLALLVAFIFAPTISVLEVGQIGPLLLIGLTGFLYFSVVNRKDWLAGPFLALASIKPQVTYLFWIALLLWVIRERRWLLIVSTSLTVILLTMIAMVFNPHIIQQYISMLQTYRIVDWANPTIGAYLRYFWFGIDKFWLQLIPPFFGGLWLIYYWYKKHTSWKWVDEIPFLLLISQITSPYTWTYDLVILIPSILQATIWIMTDWKRWSTFFLVIIYLCINILDLLLHRTLSDFWFIWLAPALLIWFWLTRRLHSNLKDKYIPVISDSTQ